MTTLNPDLSKPTCRVCLQNKEDESMLSIFDLDVDFHDLHIYEKIEQCVGIKMICHKEVPTLICSYCSEILKISFEFRTTCRSSEEFLKVIVATEAFESKPEVSLAENPLSVVDKSSTKKEINAEYETGLRDIPSPITHAIKEYSPPYSPTKYEEFINNDSDEEWINIDYSDDEDSLSCSENIEDSLDEAVLDIKEENEESNKDKKSNQRKRKPKNKKNKFNKEISKTLEISPDGEAIMREKKTRNKRIRRKQPHVCEICGNVYNRRGVLEQHIKRHSDVKEFKCEICGYAFHSNYEITRHMRKHTGSKPYKCSYCSRAFGDHSTLTKHERVHRNERPFKCDICGQCFSYTGVLKRHKLVHTGAKPYKCEICGKCFNDPYHLKSHLKTIQHQNDPRVEMLLQNVRKNNEDEI